MKAFFLSPATLLLCVLIGLVVLRSDTMGAAHAVHARALAEPLVARLDAQRAAAAAESPPLRRAWTVGTATPPAATDAAPWSLADSLAPVYIVTSRDTWQGIRGLARDAVARRDSTGMPLSQPLLRQQFRQDPGRMDPQPLAVARHRPQPCHH